MGREREREREREKEGEREAERGGEKERKRGRESERKNERQKEKQRQRNRYHKEYYTGPCCSQLGPFASWARLRPRPVCVLVLLERRFVCFLSGRCCARCPPPRPQPPRPQPPTASHMSTAPSTLFTNHIIDSRTAPTQNRSFLNITEEQKLKFLQNSKILRRNKN